MLSFLLGYQIVYSCTCAVIPQSFCESIGGSNRDIFLARVVNNDPTDFRVKVIESLYGQSDLDTIYFDERNSCTEELYLLRDADTLLLSFSYLRNRIGLLTHCGKYFLHLENDTLRSGVYPDQRDMAWSDFKRDFHNCIEINPRVDLRGRMVAWTDRQTPLKNFSFRIDDLDVTTNKEGDFYLKDFPFLRGGLLYIAVKPYQNGNLQRGVSSKDAMLLQKHMLGLQRLSHPEQFIAADINNSQSISVFDLVLLKKILLGRTTELTYNTSWRFVRQDYFFSVAGNPWIQRIPESSWITYLYGYQVAGLNFRAIKIGDIDGSVFEER